MGDDGAGDGKEGQEEAERRTIWIKVREGKEDNFAHVCRSKKGGKGAGGERLNPPVYPSKMSSDVPCPCRGRPGT